MMTSKTRVKILFVKAVLVLIFLFPSFVFVAEAAERDWSQYYFTGKVDVEKYSEFNKCGYREGLEVKFHIYDNMIFAECYGEFGFRSYGFSSKKYTLITNEGIDLSLVVNDGRIVDFKVGNIKKLQNVQRLNIAKNSCEIARFVGNFSKAYRWVEISSRKIKGYKMYVFGSYNKNDGKYVYGDWLLDILKYKNLTMALYHIEEEEDFMMLNGNVCIRKISVNNSDYSKDARDDVVVKTSCNSKEEKIYLKIKNCVVTKYQGQF